MSSFKEMLCVNIHGGHSIQGDGIIQLGYDPNALCWLFIIICSRCSKTSIVDRQTLDNMLFKDKHNFTDVEDNDPENE